MTPSELVDAMGKGLVKGVVYKIASVPDCDNRFRCVAVDDLNETMFIRENDKMVHLGREFIAFRQGVRYYDLFRDNAPLTDRRPGAGSVRGVVDAQGGAE
jgi:hypothetical protein